MPSFTELRPIGSQSSPSQVIKPPGWGALGGRACALDNGYGAARGTCESFCKFKCFFCWDKTHLFNGFTALTDIGDLAWLKASFLDARGILMNDQATNWAGRELNLHWGFDELRADRVHKKQAEMKATECSELHLASGSRYQGM